MKAGKRIPKPARIGAAALGAVLALAFLLAFLAGARTQAAALRNSVADADPRIQAITVTSNLPISDTHPGEGVTKTIYFNNAVPGVITLTFDISGTPTLTLTAGAAFDEPERVYTASITQPLFTITYTVATTHVTQPGIIYTMTNANGLQTVAITHVRDITAPTVLSPSVAADSAYICAVETALYYTNTMKAAQAFEVRGKTTDALSGLHKATFSEAFGFTPADCLFPTSFVGVYNILAGSTGTGIITATMHDWVNNTGIQTYTYDLDGVPPYTGSVTIGGGREYISRTVAPLTLFAADAGCGVKQMCVSEETFCSAWEDYTTTKSWNLAAGDGWKTVHVWYRDFLGNTSDFYTDSIFLDTIAPVVTVTVTPYTTVTTFLVSWEAFDPEPGSGVVSYTVAYREDEGAWVIWHPSTTLTQATFSSGTLEHTYVFSVTAYDRAGNSAEGTATTRIGPFHVYLPLTLHGWVWWYQYDVYEPNDTPAQAWGALKPDVVYEAYIWDATDQEDYYHFTPSTGTDIHVGLTNIPSGCDYDLYVYYYDGQYQLVALSNQSGNLPEDVAFTPVAGRKYYVRVYPYSGFSSQQPYRLTATYQ